MPDSYTSFFQILVQQVYMRKSFEDKSLLVLDGCVSLWV